MRILILLVAVFTLAGCVKSGYKNFYTPIVNAKTLPDVELISVGQEPQIIGTDNLDRDVLILRSKKYIAVGYSSFNGGYEDTKNAAEQAKSVGATIVLVSSEYTNTQTSTTTLLLPDNKTTYYSGSVYGNTSYQSTNNGYIGNSTTTGTYSGTATTFGTKSVPISSQQKLYDQKAVYFVKSNKKYKFGVQSSDLTPTQRTQYERNTGVLIDVVIEDSPAFYSNILAGDVLISIDGATVKNTNHAIQLMSSIPPSQKQSVFRVIRNYQEKDIQITF